jgi:hypothetical protein
MANTEEPPVDAPGVDPVPRFSTPSNVAYEFSERENVLIAGLASRMRFVGLLAFATGALVVVLGALRIDPLWIFSGAFSTLIGLWTHRASVSFRDVVQTEGHDIPHLMQALEDLRKLYTLQFWAGFLGLLVMLGVVIVVITTVVRAH